MEKNSIKIFMGIDLAGSKYRSTGVAFLDKNLRIILEPNEVLTDKEILDCIDRLQPEWIGIDAPLSFPKSRNKMRLCDRKIRNFGSPAFSPLLLSSLTERAIQLHHILSRKGYRCIEVYPRATQNILKIKTEGKKPTRIWRSSLQKELLKWIRNLTPPEKRLYSSHILDAILCAYTAYCRWRGNYQEIGDEEGRIVIPSF